jgi:hypothetical protein
VNGTLSKTKKLLTISGLSASNKIYDASNDATISNYGTLNGILFSDVVSLDTGSLGADPANFNNKNVGSGKTVTLSLNNGNLTGAAAGNYRINNGTYDCRYYRQAHYDQWNKCES